ncbi:MAG: MotA/TolQ/ExbB proton channel family protein, partial [Opitutales bacterium]
QGMGGDSSKQMAGDISSALWTTAAGLITAIPTLIAYFIYKTKFGNIAAEINRVSGEMVFTLVRGARNPDAFAEQEEVYAEEDLGTVPPMDPGLPPPGPEALPPPGLPPS